MTSTDLQFAAYAARLPRVAARCIAEGRTEWLDTYLQIIPKHRDFARCQAAWRNEIGNWHALVDTIAFDYNVHTHDVYDALRNYR